MEWTEEKLTKLELILYRLLSSIRRSSEQPVRFMEAEFKDTHDMIFDLFKK